MKLADIEWIHDLKLPLQLIRASAELIQMYRFDPTLDIDACLDGLIASVQQLDQMLAAAMTGAEDAPSRFDVIECLRGLWLRSQGAARAAGVTLDFSANVDALDIEASENALTRIAMNLIANALKAAPSGGRVALRCRALGDFIEITVANDGPGIPPERLPFLFLPGETGGAPGQARPDRDDLSPAEGGAHGYGLSSALRLARDMGGQLTAESDPGRRTAFTLRLPARQSRRRAG